MIIPKIIWAVWLDFNNKKDGDIDKNINFFINNIKIHHINNDWKINIITKWNDLICILNNNEDGKKIINFLDNKFIGGAHKSDLVRFYLLIL